MVVPFISSVSREVLESVPVAQREGAYALGATRFEAIRAVVFYARTGIIGAIMLGFGRALGETMAVTMVIGNNPRVSLSLFAPQYTMAAVIANEFTEAADELYLSALVEIGLVLFVITLLVNTLSRLLLWSMNRSRRRVAARKPAAVTHDVDAAPQGAVGDRDGVLRRLGAAGARASGLRALLRRQPGHPIDQPRLLHALAAAGRRAGRRDGERDRRHADRERAGRRHGRADRRPQRAFTWPSTPARGSPG
jgi:hypothetical protein